MLDVREHDRSAGTLLKLAQTHLGSRNGGTPATAQSPMRTASPHKSMSNMIPPMRHAIPPARSLRSSQFQPRRPGASKGSRNGPGSRTQAVACCRSSTSDDGPGSGNAAPRFFLTHLRSLNARGSSAQVAGFKLRCRTIGSSLATHHLSFLPSMRQGSARVFKHVPSGPTQSS